ncbi:ROK family protein [Nordella sp. HKS 07]|uniref:N-acetylmannosamine kinase n=1 Tax=Nordella sp. HKS 07 TaxID=2712222 RepID=UPI0013E1BB18|nr:N-acetylmannosamine kinase [Nordella sp. HKS 07]QIG50599.1 ROK family protein [Nordella sp. HKS 07]
MTATTEPTVAVNIGGSKIAVARIEGGGITERHQTATPRTGHGHDLADAVATIVRKISANPARLGVATTGIVAEGCLTALVPGTLPVENNYPIVASLRRRLGVEPLVVNDAQAAAFHESRQAGEIVRRLAFITVSTGIAAGIVIDGKLQIGRHGLAGHAGHMTVDGSGPLCGCGRRGCVETLASGTAIARRASDVIGKEMSAPAVFAAAHQGDEHCVRVIEDAVQALAAMIADLVASLDLDLIRLGGGIGIVPSFLHRLRATMEDLPAIYRRPIEPARGGAEAGLLGVAALLDVKLPQ